MYLALDWEPSAKKYHYNEDAAEVSYVQFLLFGEHYCLESVYRVHLHKVCKSILSYFYVEGMPG